MAFILRQDQDSIMAAAVGQQSKFPTKWKKIMNIFSVGK